MKILELDLGNTCCHWRVLDDGVCLRLDKVVHEHSEEHIIGNLRDCGDVVRVRMSSVANQALTEALIARLDKALGLESELARSFSYTAGVTNSYADPSAMGVDRWCAMVAAFNAVGRSVVVVDAGSALTIDWVDDSGKHRGGYIIPGLNTMYESLVKKTGRVRFNKAVSLSINLGCSTDEAVNSGVASAMLGAVKVAIERAEAESQVAVMLTGGDACALSSVFPEQCVLHDTLVMDGLQYLLP